MVGKLRVPSRLRASIETGGPAWAAWLAALADHVEELAERWGLELGEPFEPGGNCSWVAPAVDGAGRDVVLKVAWHAEALHEADLLNCGQSLQADPVGLLGEVAELAGLDPGRVWQWLLARCVQETLGEGPSPCSDLEIVLRKLGRP